MKTFNHVNAGSLEEAASILEHTVGKASVIAGGTDLLGTLKDDIHANYAELLVNLKTIHGLEYLREDTESLKIGPLTKLHSLETSRIVNDRYKVLAEAAHTVASPQIRKMGTIGGNICQEPRCWYYRCPENTFHCIRKGGNSCNALKGENHFHSIFGAAKVEDPPCSSNCPGRVNIPSYLALIREGDILRAADTLLQRNPLPAITGRVCPHFCEDYCNRNEFDKSVSIRNIERYIGDYVLDNAKKLLSGSQADTGKSVAIVGSGPAGLSAAHFLRVFGHRVTVFEKMEEAGGMLTYAIPSYRLPKNIVKRVIRTVQDMGVEFRLGVEVGKDITLEDLHKDFDSVFLASGAWGRPSIGLDGEDLTVSGLDFLTKVNLGGRQKPGEKVLVIGGGNVALDAAISAKRLGADQVVVACLECREEMPAFDWEIEEAVQEKVQLMPSWGPSRVLRSNEKVTGMELIRCTSVFDNECRFSPTFDETEKCTIEADSVIMAVGQKPEPFFVGSEVGTEQGLILVNQSTQQTNVPGLYAGGDCTSGPATVIEAIAAGRRAAASIDLYLGATESIGRGSNQPKKELLKFDRSCLQKSDRATMPEVAASKRKIDVEDYLGLEPNEVEKEARRCFNCGCVAVCPSDLAPALIALDATIKSTKRVLKAEEFFSAGASKSTILAADELVEEIQVPRPKQGSKSGYLKFRIRNSIDFPIASVATHFDMESNAIRDVRIVLGAVAPFPVRLKEVEQFLKGKEVTETLAQEAADMAITETIPLSKNGYKVQITRALVRRAILSTGA